MIQRSDSLPTLLSVTLSDTVAKLAERRLGNSGYRVLQQVQCEYHAGTLTLHGHVPSFYMKQVAQTVVKSLGSVQCIDNQLDVDSDYKR